MKLTRSEAAWLVAMTCGLIVFAAWLLSGVAATTSTIIVSHVGAIAFSSFAFAWALKAGLTNQGRQRASWLVLSLGPACWVLGDLICIGYDLIGRTEPPFPTTAYLVVPLAACAAALFTPGGPVGLRLLLDGVIVASSLVTVAWSLGLGGVYAAGHVTAAQGVVSVTYLAVLAMFAMTLPRTPPGRRWPPTLLMIGILTIGGAGWVHVGALSTNHGAAVTLGGALGMLLFGAAALASRPSSTNPTVALRPPARVTLWLPYVAVPFAVALAAPEVWARTSTRPLIVLGLVLVLAALARQFTLLDENHDLLATVADMALRDPLTGLPNRALFADRLAHAMQHRFRRAPATTVLLLDLDDFKVINDSLGHAAGDTLLREVGDRVHRALRAGDTVARLGGDEFAILIEDDDAVARNVAARVVETFDEPFVLDGRGVFVRPSVGLASTMRDEPDDPTGDELFRRADLAMYSAKRAGFSGVRVYDPNMRHDATELRLAQQATLGTHDGIARFQLLGELRHAIAEGELILLYQPKVSLATEQVVGVEALVRWPHQKLGMLEPADFLPLVKRSGLMDALSDLVIRRAVHDAAAWHSEGVDIPVAINLSAPSLDDPTLPERIQSVLAEYDMPVGSLSVEITEDILLTSIRRTRAVLERLRHNGIRVAIDDFGSGYATMSYLRDLPVDELKLDRQFIAPIMYDPRAAAIVQSVIALAHTFGLASVAEGVENEVTANRLKEYGCGFAQGHYYSKPVCEESIRRGLWEPASVTPIAATPPSWA